MQDLRLNDAIAEREGGQKHFSGAHQAEPAAPRQQHSSQTPPMRFHVLGGALLSSGRFMEPSSPRAAQFTYMENSYLHCVRQAPAPRVCV